MPGSIEPRSASALWMDGFLTEVPQRRFIDCIDMTLRTPQIKGPLNDSQSVLPLNIRRLIELALTNHVA